MKLETNQMKTLCFIILISIVFSACTKSENDYKNDFLRNEKKIDELYVYLKSNYMDKYRNNRNRIYFDNCNKKDRKFPKGMCDDFVTEKMEELGIREISLEKNFCNQTNEFDEVYLTLDKSSYYPIVSYTFNT
ncbi:hypothetical protein QNI19_38020 [Cytophagaceae bacterium DM2B3-1]|uniref:Lipoprotein n=1 Tax=Xanthocytophaga flava TaxID=3048013 RepID=A0ABT7D1X5_9BACT|nr:hypothetical protein [Xanthocytophaga flavus]MDJ1498789.1 hypothetical protein [Xanthocytophaga flavus]